MRHHRAEKVERRRRNRLCSSGSDSISLRDPEHGPLLREAARAPTARAQHRRRGSAAGRREREHDEGGASAFGAGIGAVHHVVLDAYYRDAIIR